MDTNYYHTKYLLKQEILYVASELELRFGNPPSGIYFSCYDTPYKNSHITIFEIVIIFDDNENFRISMSLEKTDTTTNISQSQLNTGNCIEISITTPVQALSIFHSLLQYWELTNTEVFEKENNDYFRFFKIRK